MKIIDAHLHFVPDDPYFNQIAETAGHANNLKHLQSEYGRLGIAGGVVMGNRGLEPERHRYPAWLRYCIGLDGSYLRQHLVRESLDQIEYHLRQEQCAGIKLYPGYNPTYVTDAVYEPVYELAACYNKPVAVHMGETAGTGALLKYAHPLTLDEAAVLHPNVRFVMCHFGNPWLADAAAVLGKNPNVWADLSGLLEGKVNVPELICEKRGYVETLKTWLSYIDYEKVMFGTDWPLANLDAYIEFVSRITPEKYHEDMFWNNAAGLYGFRSTMRGNI